MPRFWLCLQPTSASNPLCLEAWLSFSSFLLPGRLPLPRAFASRSPEHYSLKPSSMPSFQLNFKDTTSISSNIPLNQDKLKNLSRDQNKRIKKKIICGDPFCLKPGPSSTAPRDESLELSFWSSLTRAWPPQAALKSLPQTRLLEIDPRTTTSSSLSWTSASCFLSHHLLKSVPRPKSWTRPSQTTEQLTKHLQCLVWSYTLHWINYLVLLFRARRCLEVASTNLKPLLHTTPRTSLIASRSCTSNQNHGPLHHELDLQATSSSHYHESHLLKLFS